MNFGIRKGASALLALLMPAAVLAQGGTGGTGGQANDSEEWGRRLRDLENKVGVLTEEVQRYRADGKTPDAAVGSFGFAPAASKIYRTEQGLAIGGYGELLYERFDDTRDDGSATDRADRWDLLRAVLYTGYRFNERMLVNTEIEFEHGSTDQGGSVSVEFAYLDWFWLPQVNFRGGLLLVPMGFINELHEPTVFLGARRPELEQHILPTTWRENGVGFFGDLGPFAYRTYLMNGFDASGFSANGFRGGRQKGAQADADGLAWTGRLDFQGIPGGLFGASAYIGKSGQNSGLDVPTRIYSLHADYRLRGVEFRSVAAYSHVGEAAELEAANPGTPGIGTNPWGYYLQLGYDVFSLLGDNGALIPFVRFDRLATQANRSPGVTASPASDRNVWTYGVNYKPIDQVVFKLDFQNYSNAGGTGVDQANFLIGYAF